METMGSGFPKAMEVAVLISGHQLIAVSQHKGGLRLLTRLEIFDLAAVFGLDGDELNKMLGQHGMLHRAYLDLNSAALNFHNRYVLLGGAVSGAWNQLGHLLATAHDRYAGGMNKGDDIAAVLTAIKFHNNNSSHYLLIILL